MRLPQLSHCLPYLYSKGRSSVRKPCAAGCGGRAKFYPQSHATMAFKCAVALLALAAVAAALTDSEQEVLDRLLNALTDSEQEVLNKRLNKQANEVRVKRGSVFQYGARRCPTARLSDPPRV